MIDGGIDINKYYYKNLPITNIFSSHINCFIK